jgi:hypothetical protein
MPRPTRLALLLLAAALIAVVGCSKQEEKPSKEVAPATVPPARKPEARVVVPGEVQGKWAAVKIAVLDKDHNKEQVYTIEIGSEFALPDSGLVLKVRNFLPAFIMDGTTMTSASNETRNPAAQIVISEGKTEVFKGWLFSLYPGTHAFQHPRYSFTLVDFVPATAKKD